MNLSIRYSKAYSDVTLCDKYMQDDTGALKNIVNSKRLIVEVTCVPTTDVPNGINGRVRFRDSTHRSDEKLCEPRTLCSFDLICSNLSAGTTFDVEVRSSPALQRWMREVVEWALEYQQKAPPPAFDSNLIAQVRCSTLPLAPEAPNRLKAAELLYDYGPKQITTRPKEVMYKSLTDSVSTKRKRAVIRLEWESSVENGYPIHTYELQRAVVTIIDNIEHASAWELIYAGPHKGHTDVLWESMNKDVTITEVQYTVRAKNALGVSKTSSVLNIRLNLESHRYSNPDDDRYPVVEALIPGVRNSSPIGTEPVSEEITTEMLLSSLANTSPLIQQLTNSGVGAHTRTEPARLW